MERGIASMPSSRGLLSAILVVLFASLVCTSAAVLADTGYSSDRFLEEPFELPGTGDTSTVDSSSTAAVASAESEPKDDFNAGSRVLWLIFKIVAFLSLVVLGIFGVTKLLQKSGLAPANNEFMSLHTSLPIGQNQFLRIVRVGKKYIVIGVSSESINHICEINDPEIIQDLRLTDGNEKDGEAESGFSKILSRFVGTQNHSFSDKKSKSEPNFENLQARLKNLKNSEGHVEG
jgi:flagellar biosynthetic protein FliO